MSLIPLIIDAEAFGAGQEGRQGSLLTLPLGGGTVLRYFVSMLSPLSAGGTLILRRSANQQHSLLSAEDSDISATVLTPETLSAHVAEKLDNSDYLLVIDARRWCPASDERSMIEGCLRDYRGATYFIAIGSDADGTRELVECDKAGTVKRIRRFYNSMNWPEVAGHAIAYALVPASAIIGLHFETLPELRQRLLASGILGRDMPVPCDMLDLTSESGFLTLQEQAIADLTRTENSENLQKRSPGVWVGSNCRIHDTVRMIPPVILHHDVQVDGDAALVGPLTIGPGTIIGRGAMIAQSAIADDVRVAERATIRRRVVTQASLHDQMVVESDISVELENTSSEDNLFMGSKLEFSLPSPSQSRWVHFAAKRTLDVVASFVALIVLSPLLLIIAVLVKLDSRGPIFFSHRRESKGGKDFPCIKFRTMVPDAHQKQRELYQNNQVDGPQFKMTHDPRMTRIGRWLRATNLDELPQLVNVLLGHMSLVGPRPSPFRENQICVPWRRARLSVRSGITGLWQICRSEDRARGDFHEWIYYDIMYVRHFSFWLDLKILLMTFLTLGGSWRLPFSWLIKSKNPGASAGSGVTLVSSD